MLYGHTSLTKANTTPSSSPPPLLLLCAQMLSLSLLDAMFSIDRDGSWLRFIVSRGYLAKLAASLLWEDEALQKMLHPLPDTLRALYVHESRMVGLELQYPLIMSS